MITAIRQDALRVYYSAQQQQIMSHL